MNYQRMHYDEKFQPLFDIVNHRNESLVLKNNSIAGLVTFYPEQNHINAQPNKIFEYMASGLPVIGSKFPFWEEIITKNNAGLCVDPMSPIAIGEAINYILNNPKEAKTK